MGKKKKPMSNSLSISDLERWLQQPTTAKMVEVFKIMRTASLESLTNQEDTTKILKAIGRAEGIGAVVQLFERTFEDTENKEEILLEICEIFSKGSL